MKKLIFASMFVLSGLGFSYAESFMPVNNLVNKEYEVNVDSVVIQNILASNSIKSITLNSDDRCVMFKNIGTKQVWVGYNATISTWSVNTTSTNNLTFPIESGVTYQEQFRGTIYFLSDDLSTSTDTVKVIRLRNK